MFYALCVYASPPPTSSHRMSAFKPWKSEFALWYLTDTQVEKVNYPHKAFWQESWLMSQLYHKTTTYGKCTCYKSVSMALSWGRGTTEPTTPSSPFQTASRKYKSKISLFFLPSKGPRSPLVFCVSVQRCLGERGWMNTRRFRLFSWSHRRESSLLKPEV